MPDFSLRERQFEEDIERSLITEGGYLKGDPKAFDRELALDTGTFISFIRSSQPKEWRRHERIYGAESGRQLVNRFSKEVADNGLLHVLRQGFTDRGTVFRAVFWKPESSLNQAARDAYGRNILHCTRQLHYSPRNENSIDIVLFLNGVPVVSMELKCQFTGQDASNAVQQYRLDRSGKDRIFAFKERVLVHFAVDLTEVRMATRLEGPATRFMPFNKGSGGAGSVGGKGNPPNPGGYDTAYLWEEVLAKDSLLEILHKYMHLQTERDGGGRVVAERMIFPRYHQLDVVTRLLADVRENGAGRNYLIQHSAGSGKSNSIAWLAHRLAGLHDSDDRKVFQSVVIVTDRRVLDRQLQDTVYQFDHVAGTVRKIDQSARQLKEALEEGVPIIITTLQKFPVIYGEVEVPGKCFAVIVDEAHSSQTGTAARKMKSALADKEAALEEFARMEEETPDPGDRLLDELAAHGNHRNLSFFAFTATPKGKTLDMFGSPHEDGKRYPYHVYSMRQAIEEGFILDVLGNYVTYGMYYKLLKNIDSDPELDSSSATKAILRYQTLHPHNISQKTAVMLAHFCSVTRHKIGGRAKAMVVTQSRLHAVRYFQEFRRQIDEKGLDVGVLVAFSGEIGDDSGDYTETGLNVTKDGKHIPESALPSAFHSDGYGILIVAEKYQTGFDEPLLHTMFVDKKLSGVKAVQTLSRLNRTCRGKTDTFVLDFVNTAEEIKAAFDPYYEATVLGTATDPNVVYDLKNTLDRFGVYREEEIRRYAELYFSPGEQQDGDLGKLQGALRPAIERYSALSEEERNTFKPALARFNRIYSFITQVCRLFDRDIHRFSVYAKALYAFLPKDARWEEDLDGAVLLEYYRLEKEFEGGIQLEAAEDGFKPVSGESGRLERKTSRLEEIIDTINERFGTDFTEMDKVLLQLVRDYTSKEQWSGFARNNDYRTFSQLFDKDFNQTAVDRYMQNDRFFKWLFSNEDAMNYVREAVCNEVYNSSRG